MDRNVLFAHVSFTRDLSPTIIAALSSHANEQTVERGQIITLEGDPAVAMYLVYSGRIKVVRHSIEGREHILHVVEAYDHFNTVPMFREARCPATSEALVTSQLLAIPREHIRQVAQQHPELALAMLGEFCNRLHNLVGLVENLAVHTVNGRLARLLLQQAALAEQNPNLAPLTQAEMAAHIGSVREMVGRALKAFDAQGLIRLERGMIEIIDPQGLAAQAEL